MAALGPTRLLKDLPPSKNFAHGDAALLKLAVFQKKEDADKLIQRGYIIVRGERLLCHPLHSGGPKEMPATAAPVAVPTARFAAWLSGGHLILIVIYGY